MCTGNSCTETELSLIPDAGAAKAREARDGEGEVLFSLVFMRSPGTKAAFLLIYLQLSTPARTSQILGSVHIVGEQATGEPLGRRIRILESFRQPWDRHGSCFACKVHAFWTACIPSTSTPEMLYIMFESNTNMYMYLCTYIYNYLLSD